MSTVATGAPAVPQIESISAVTLATHDMARGVRFYSALGFPIRYGGELAAFTSFHAGSGYLNLVAAPKDQRWSSWGRVIFYVSDVDGLYRHAVAIGGSGASRALKAKRRISLMYASIMVSALGPRLFAARRLRETGLVRTRISVVGRPCNFAPTSPIL